MLAYLAACVVVQTVYGDTALPRTDVLGVDVSKMTEQEIVALWEKHRAFTVGYQVSDGERCGYRQRVAGGAGRHRRRRNWRLSPLVRPGGRSWGGGALAWLRGGWEYIHSWFAQTSAVPSFDVDSAALDAACEKLSASLNCTVVDGGYRLEKGEGLYITKPADGRTPDAPKLERDLTAMLQSGALRPVACVYEEKKAETVDVQALHDQLAERWRPSATRRQASPPSPTSAWPSMWRRCRRQLDAAPAGTEFLADAQVEFPTASRNAAECMFRDVLGTCTTKCAWAVAVTRTSSWRPPPSTAGSTTPARSSGTTPRWGSARWPVATMRRVSTRRVHHHRHRRSSSGVLHAVLRGDAQRPADRPAVLPYVQPRLPAHRLRRHGEPGVGRTSPSATAGTTPSRSSRPTTTTPMS